MTTTIIETTTQAAETIAAITKKLQNSPTGVSFFGVREYTNKAGEVSNYTINIGIDYEASKAKDIETLLNMDVTAQGFKSESTLLEQAKTELIEAFRKPNEAMSAGQTEAYEHIVPNVKRHLTNNLLYIFGSRVNKKVLVKGTYKATNKRPLTIAKDELRAKLRTGKMRMFILAPYDLKFEIMSAGDIDVKVYGDMDTTED